MDTEYLLEKLTSAVSYVYKSRLAPSVLLSKLPNGQYYGSIIRYGNDHTDKEVMHRAKGGSIADVLNDLSGQIVMAGKTQKQINPVDELEMIVNGKI